MANPMVKLVNSETGEEIERTMTDQEFAEFKSFQKLLKDEQDAKNALQSKKLEVLTKLGLTAEELAAVLS
jgi:hypothetical protein